jgi:hypothetical protein
LYVQVVAGRTMVHKVEAPCMTVIAPVGLVGAEDAGVVNPMLKTTGRFTVGDTVVALSVYTGVSFATEIPSAVASALLKLLSPEYVPPIETDPAGSDEVVQMASRVFPTLLTAGAEVPEHPVMLAPFAVKLTVPVGVLGEPLEAPITPVRMTGVSTVGVVVPRCSVSVEATGVSVTGVLAGVSTVKLPFVSV